ncbi:MAG: uracil-DNA glycosylase [Anaerolineaceae bacterium]|nr:uracil-DNA glycosylase [Anaerolineaceae bacterium]MDE0327984.1 uracil-DNA glycosylase [Anaerolineaceae bacterium]
MSDWSEAFVDTLARTACGAQLFNQYADTSASNATRRANLGRYLRDMEARRPEALLLFEAPGYRGCRLTGIPVTSRRVLLEGLPGLGLFGRERGYADVAEAGFERIQGEQSATILWRALADLGVAPLIWNSVPFHPHRAGQMLSNRPPRAAELAQGCDVLRELLARFRPRTLVAVGRSAQGSLAALGLEHHALRHPAHGGSGEFVAGLRALCVEAGLSAPNP